MNTRRRQLVLATAASLVPTRALPIAPLVPFIVPSFLVGVFSLITTRQQMALSMQQHAEQMRLSDTNIRLAIEQLRFNAYQSERNEAITILATLLGKDERLAQTFLSNSPILQNLAFDANGRVNLPLSGNIDARGTFLGVDRGELAVGRGSVLGRLTNQEAVDLGRIVYSSGDPFPIPVTAPTELTGAESRRVKELIAERKGLSSVEAFDRTASLMAIRKYARGRRGTVDGADLESVAVVSKTADSQGRYPIGFVYLG